jgi:hypothetical protein
MFFKSSDLKGCNAYVIFNQKEDFTPQQNQARVTFSKCQCFDLLIQLSNNNWGKHNFKMLNIVTI